MWVQVGHPENGEAPGEGIPRRKLVVYANANCEMACPAAMKSSPCNCPLPGKYMKIVLTLDKRQSRLAGQWVWAGRGLGWP